MGGGVHDDDEPDSRGQGSGGDDTSRRTRWTSTWLGGARSAADLGYPGEQLGLPETGPGAVAPYGRRIYALFVDWIFASMAAYVIFRTVGGWNLLLFAVEVWVLTAMIGQSVGKRIAGLRVVRLDGRPVGFGWSLARVLLLLAVIPALMWDRDYRGLHDRAANTVVVRT